MADVAHAFIAQSRRFLSDDYLPKIERCLEQLSDEQVWWRANDKSNSIGNLILHISGNARQWIVSGLGGEQDNRRRDDEFAEQYLCEFRCEDGHHRLQRRKRGSRKSARDQAADHDCGDDFKSAAESL